MHTNRRQFLQTSLASGSLVAMGLTVPGFLSRTALAAQPSHRAGAKDSILVVIQLTGGNDGLNTVIPFADENYAKYRPTLKIAKNQIKKVNDSIGLHPSLEGLAGILQEQALGIVQGVGYPNPSQSHFRSMDIWQAGSTAENLTEGWIGKALKGLPSTPAFHLAEQNENSPLALDGSPTRVPSLTSLKDFQLQTASATGTDARNQRSLIEGVARAAIASTSPEPSLLDFVQRTSVNTYDSSRRLQELAKNYQPKSTYPNTPLANRLKLAAQLINADLGARVFYVSQNGYDTHSSQANSHANLLRTLSEAMTAFYKDLAARGHKDRILIMTFSEFGRRAKENGSKGTDHGSGAPMFLVGGKVQSGLIGEHPSLAQLEAGNLKHHTDFRQVYAAVLDQWMGVSSKDVLGKVYEPVKIFKS